MASHRDEISSSLQESLRLLNEASGLRGPQVVESRAPMSPAPTPTACLQSLRELHAHLTRALGNAHADLLELEADMIPRSKPPVAELTPEQKANELWNAALRHRRDAEGHASKGDHEAAAVAIEASKTAQALAQKELA